MRPVHFLRASILAAACLGLAASPQPARAGQAIGRTDAAASAKAVAGPVEDFYRARGGRPLWLAPGSGKAAQQLLDLLSSASIDGLDPARYPTKPITRALSQAWGGNPRALARADSLLSAAFVAYVRDLKNPPDVGMQYVEPDLRPQPPEARALLEMAGAAPSLERFVGDMGWMDPSYAPLRRALASGRYADPRQRALLRLNLDRARALPGGPRRYVLVNAAAQRLEMYAGGRLVDSMRVVVGKQKPKDRTPMLAGKIRSASLNPYWNVPPDLAVERIAPNVVKEGLGYLQSRGYQILSGWDDSPRLADPAAVDWAAVAEGRAEVRIRQLPGPVNALGKVKFSLPNPYGIFLHDTPDRQLLKEDTRLFSGGCIRLEDADRFGRWLFGRSLTAPSKRPEIEVPLDPPVPIYLTYLTAIPDGPSITFLQDVYGWDAERLARIGGSGSLASR